MRELTKFEKDLASNALPISWKVLLLMEDVDEFADEGQLIKKTDQTKDREQIGQDKGRIIAMGGVAFTDTELYSGIVPKIGDRVLVNRHAGGRVIGYYRKTGKVLGAEGFERDELVEIDLRVVNDKDINNILTEAKKVVFDE